MTIERFRPISISRTMPEQRRADLLKFTLHTLGYRLHWYPAPAFREDNYFGNPVNHWEQNLLSLVVLGIPSKRPQSVPGLVEIKEGRLARMATTNMIGAVSLGLRGTYIARLGHSVATLKIGARIQGRQQFQRSHQSLAGKRHRSSGVQPRQ